MIVSSPPTQDSRSSVRSRSNEDVQVYSSPVVETPAAAVVPSRVESMSPTKTNDQDAVNGRSFAVHSRFQNANEDERDDALGTKQLERVALAPRPDAVRRSIPHWRDAVSQYHGRRASRRGAGPRPVVAWASRGGEEPVWRRHFRQGGTTLSVRAQSPLPAQQPGSRNLPRTMLAPRASFQGPPYRNSTGMAGRPSSQAFQPVPQAARQASYHVSMRQWRHHRPPESLPFAARPSASSQPAASRTPSRSQLPHELPRVVEVPTKVMVPSVARTPPTTAQQIRRAIASSPAKAASQVAAQGTITQASTSQLTAKPPPVDVSNVPTTRTTAKLPKRVLSPQEQNAVFKKAKGFDKLDLLCSATLEMGEMYENPAGCSCPKSKCIALYCDCFKAGRRCNPSQCSCLDCHNTVDESGANGARTKAIRNILARNPRAFQTAGMGNPLLKLPPGEVACNCVRSRCLKLYCSCFHNGKVCKPNVCTCVDCQNTEEDTGGHRKAAIRQALEKRPDAFVIKAREKGLGCACKNNRCIRKYCECFRTGLKCSAKCSCRLCENEKPAGAF